MTLVVQFRKKSSLTYAENMNDFKHQTCYVHELDLLDTYFTSECKPLDHVSFHTNLQDASSSISTWEDLYIQNRNAETPH
jgi:hypothetical protein